MPVETAWDSLCDDIRADVLKALESMHLFHLNGPKGQGFLTPEQLRTVASKAAVLELKQKDIVQQQGQTVSAVYYVLEGRLAKFHGNEIVETIARGGQIGQLHMICSDLASSSVLVETPEACCVVLTRAALDEVLMQDPRLLRAVTSNLSRALRSHVRRSKSARLVRLVEHLSSNTPEAFNEDQGDPNVDKYKPLTAAVAGLASMTLAFPLEVARTRLQMEGRGDIMHGLHVVAQMVSNEGFGACYKGWGSSAVTHTVQNTAYHSAYDYLVATFQPAGKQLSDAVRLALGVVAGCYAGVMVNPLTTVSYRLQGKGGEGYNPVSMLMKIVREEGLFSLWNGMGPTLLLAVNPCITFYMFDELKLWYLAKKREWHKQSGGTDLEVKLTPVETLVIGATAKATASALTFPLLMAKIRMGLYGRTRYPSLLMTFAIVLREEGFGGIFKGVGLSLMRSVLVAALEFVLRDKLVELITSHTRKRTRKIKVQEAGKAQAAPDGKK
eukprot:TRINITY_DN2519_c1_g1_i3.p1 TRINITY_DN2519_c1_g1~~TRINITY_DN2519_c1_g1_i3.p1  ORF type:complete len:539 (+),score=229.45 TRINITY_DN2519_c1_g1_i3:125-1618(+)